MDATHEQHDQGQTSLDDEESATISDQHAD